MKWITLCFVFVTTATSHAQKDFPALDHILPSASSDVQTAAVKDLLSRKLSDRAQDFSVHVDSSIGPKFKDTFKLEMTQDGKLSVTGTSGVAAAMGIYYYLTQYCGCHISWGGDQLNVPKPLPKLVVSPLTITSNDRFRYYQNVCTVSYSFVWWDWARWEREIDWMALSGINLPLAFNGQEAIWQRVYSKMGFSDDDLGKHFGGPAFLAWARMGNMHGWGGPLTDNWHKDQVNLQHQILKRMRELGMIPVVPAFAGHVPETFSSVFPKANVSKLGDWGSFNASYCCTTLLEVTDPMFSQIGKAFIEEYTKEFGTDHVYNADTFNEMTPRSGDPSYLSAAGKAVYQGMVAGDPMAIWLMQGWLFQSSGFWTVDRAKALLTSVPQGKMIVLDLYSEVSPKYTILQSYFGQPFIWCMLHNFGGTVAMYGALYAVNHGPFDGRTMKDSTMIGTGLTPEGINQNDMVYEFMNEQAWRKSPRDVIRWISAYSVRRYGKGHAGAVKAWKLLQGSVYNCTVFYKDHAKQVIVSAKPRLHNRLQPVVWYDPQDVFDAWKNMVNASATLGSSDLFRYDLVDVARQSLQLVAILYYDDMIASYNNKTIDSVRKSGQALLDLLSDLDKILGSDPHFLLGKWIADAKANAKNKDESMLYEFNARNQVTLWGPTGQILDYANKQWSGLVRGYYRKRWQLFVTELENALTQGKAFDEAMFGKDVFTQVELPFQTESVTYPDKPIGDSVSLAKELYQKYFPTMRQHQAYFSSLQHRDYSASEPTDLYRSYAYLEPQSKVIDNTSFKVVGGTNVVDNIVKM